MSTALDTAALPARSPSRLGRLAGVALFWAAWIGAFFAFPDYLPLLGQVAIAALFALSLDLIVGYAGIVTLGHAAFYGLGAYTAGLLAVHGWGEPLSGLLLAAAAAATLGLVTAPLVLRGGDLAGLMVTLGIAMMLYEAANKAAPLTGGADGLQGVEIWPVLGIWRFDLFGRTAYLYSLAVLALLFWLARLVAAYALSAAYAGVAGALLAQTTQFVSLDVLAFHRSAEGLPSPPRTSISSPSAERWKASTSSETNCVVCASSAPATPA